MPKRAPTQCRTQGCSGLHHGTDSEFKGFCNDCSPAAAAAHALKYRKVSQRRRERNDKLDAFYATTTWRKCRDAFIKANPLCSHCESRGRIKAADVADHIVERRDGGADYDHANLQALCSSCHNTKTAAERRKRRRT